MSYLEFKKEQLKHLKDKLRSRKESLTAWLIEIGIPFAGVIFRWGWLFCFYASAWCAVVSLPPSQFTYLRPDAFTFLFAGVVWLVIFLILNALFCEFENYDAYKCERKRNQ